MGAGKYDFIYEQGADLTFLVNYRDSANLPIDITGYTLRGQIRRRFTDSDFIPLGLSIENASQGSIRVTLDDNLMEGFIFDGVSFADRTKFVYDIEIVSPGGVVTRLLNGTISVSPEVTK